MKKKIKSLRIVKMVYLSLSILMIMSIMGYLGLLMPVEAQVPDETTVSIVRDATNFDDQSYQPNPISVKVDDIILWINEDSARHTVTKLNSEETNNTTTDQNKNAQGIIESIVNEIITNIVYNLNNLIGTKEDNPSPVMNDNSQLFSVTSDSVDNVAAFDSGIIETGDTFRYTFQESGTFEYYCTIHPNMTGKVIVS